MSFPNQFFPYQAQFDHELSIISGDFLMGILIILISLILRMPNDFDQFSNRVNYSNQCDYSNQWGSNFDYSNSNHSNLNHKWTPYHFMIQYFSIIFQFFHIRIKDYSTANGVLPNYLLIQCVSLQILIHT